MKISVVCIIYLVLAVLHKTDSVLQLNQAQKNEIVEELQNLKDVVQQVKCRKESATTFQCCISPKLGDANRLICLKFEVNIKQHDIDHYVTFNNKTLFNRRLRDGDYCRYLPLWRGTQLCINTMNSIVDLNKPVPSFDACFEIRILFSQQYYRINQQFTCFGIDKKTKFFTRDIGVSNQQSLGFVIPYKSIPLYLKGENEQAGYPTSEELSCPKDCLSTRDGIVYTYEQEVAIYVDGIIRNAILTQIHILNLINDTNGNTTSEDGSTGSIIPTLTTNGYVNSTPSDNTDNTEFTIPTYPTETFTTPSIGNTIPGTDTATARTTIYGSGPPTSEEGTTKEGTTEVGTIEEGSTEVGSTKVGTTEVGTTKEGATEVGTTKEGTTEVGTTKEGTTKEGTTEVSTTEEGTTEETTEVGTTKEATEVGTTEVGNNEVGTTEVGTTEVGTTEVASTEVGTTEVGTTKETTEVGTTKETTEVGTTKETTEVGTTKEGTTEVGSTKEGTTEVGTTKETTEVGTTKEGTTEVDTTKETTEVGTTKDLNHSEGSNDNEVPGANTNTTDTMVPTLTLIFIFSNSTSGYNVDVNKVCKAYCNL